MEETQKIELSEENKHLISQLELALEAAKSGSVKRLTLISAHTDGSCHTIIHGGTFVEHLGFTDLLKHEIVKQLKMGASESMAQDIIDKVNALGSAE